MFKPYYKKPKKKKLIGASLCKGTQYLAFFRMNQMYVFHLKSLRTSVKGKRHNTLASGYIFLFSAKEYSVCAWCGNKVKSYKVIGLFPKTNILHPSPVRNMLGLFVE